MALTDVKIRTAKPREKLYKLYDELGLYLEVHPSGGKRWRLKYSYFGKEKRISLGTYPETPLATGKNPITGSTVTGAREKRDANRQLLAEGIDPSVYRKQTKSAEAAAEENTLAALTRECFARLSAQPKKTTHPDNGGRVLIARNSAETVARKLSIMEKNVFPQLGRYPIAKTTAEDIRKILERIEERGSYEIAARVKMYTGQVFRYAIATGRAQSDPTQHLKEALTRVSVKHHAAVIKPKEIGDLLRTIRGYKGYTVTKYALEFSPLVFARPGELRKAEWADVDLAKAEWSLPGEVMKMKEPHLVPLSRQAVEILRQVQSLTGRGRFIFPCSRSSSRPMSEGTILAALRRLGYTKDEMTGHGFRAMARTVLEEILGFRPEIIEIQLSHKVSDPNGRAYNRTTHLDYRRDMMQKWADYLDERRVTKEDEEQNAQTIRMGHA